MAPPDSKLYKKAQDEGFKAVPIIYKRRYIPWLTFKIKRFIEKNRIDIVNTHSSKDSWIALPAARLARNTPLVIRTRHLSTLIGKNLLSRILYNSLPHYVITTGEAIRKQMINHNRFNPEKIISIPTGVDTEQFKPGCEFKDIREELGLSSSTPLIGTLSVLRSWKGIDYIVRAMPLIVREMPSVRLVVAGDGIHRNTLEKTIKDTGVEQLVYMLGYRKDVINILSSLNILVHPSYANEGVPQSILQAMALGRPVISSELEPLKEVVINGKTGITVPPKNPSALSKAIIRLLKDESLQETIVSNARRLVEGKYSYKSMLDRLEEIYKKRQQPK